MVRGIIMTKVYRLYYRRFYNRPTQYIDVYAVSGKQAIYFFRRTYGYAFTHACVAYGVDRIYQSDDDEDLGTIKGVNYDLQEDTTDTDNVGYYVRR